MAIDLSSTRVRLALWLLDGVRQGQPLGGLLGYRFEGDRYDAGDRFGYLKANIMFALKRPELAGPLRQLMRELDRR